LEVIEDLAVYSKHQTMLFMAWAGGMNLYEKKLLHFQNLHALHSKAK